MCKLGGNNLHFSIHWDNKENRFYHFGFEQVTVWYRKTSEEKKRQRKKNYQNVHFSLILMKKFFLLFKKQKSVRRIYASFIHSSLPREKYKTLYQKLI